MTTVNHDAGCVHHGRRRVAVRPDRRRSRRSAGARPPARPPAAGGAAPGVAAARPPAGRGAGELEDLAQQSADDALMAVLRSWTPSRDAAGSPRGPTSSACCTRASPYAARPGATARSRCPTPWPWSTPHPTRPPSARPRQLARAVQAAIATELTPHQRRVLLALLVEGVPIDVLADRLGSTRNALYKTLHDARRRLRAALTAERPPRDPSRPEHPMTEPTRGLNAETVTSLIADTSPYLSCDDCFAPDRRVRRAAPGRPGLRRPGDEGSPCRMWCLRGGGRDASGAADRGRLRIACSLPERSG